MAFVTKTWKDRLVEFAGRRKLKNVSTNEEVLYDVSRSEGTVMQAGDSFNATNMNDLEQRIKTEFDNVNSSLGGLKFGKDSDGNYGYIKDGADTVIPFKTTEIVALGTGTSFNVSSYEGYKSFTLNDFIVEPVVGAFSNMSKCGKVDNYNVTGIVKLNVTKSYNASTGILTASVTASGGFGTNNSGNFSGSSSTATSMKAFLIMK